MNEEFWNPWKLAMVYRNRRWVAAHLFWIGENPIPIILVDKTIKPRRINDRRRTRGSKKN